MKAAYITPAVTLLDKKGELDLENNGRLYENLIANGMDGILVLGSIGEFFAFSMEQRRKLADFAIQTVAGRVKLLIGTASMNYEEVPAFSNECLEKGADAVIVVSPYYFPLAEEASFDYFDRLAKEIRGPLYLYNFPDRTGYSLAPKVVLRLAEKHLNIVGIKDTLPGMGHTRELIKLIKPQRPDFEIYSGFDDNLVHNVLSGGDGCISGISNVFPEICSAWTNALRQEDIQGIKEGQRRINELFDIYQIGSAFIPIIKEAARLRGIVDTSVCTFPFSPVTDSQREQIRKLISR